MTYLALFVITAVASAHWIRYGQARGCRMAWVGAATYATGAIGAGLYVGWAHCPISPVSIRYGLAAGAALGVTYLFFNATIRRLGVGVAHFSRQLALAIPLLASLLIWHEPLTISRGLGFALTFAAICLISRPGKSQAEGAEGGLPLLPAVLLISAGLTITIFKAYAERGIVGGQPTYLTCLAAAGALTVAILAIRTEGRPGWKDIGHGFVLGIDNILMNTTVP